MPHVCSQLRAACDCVGHFLDVRREEINGAAAGPPRHPTCPLQNQHHHQLLSRISSVERGYASTRVKGRYSRHGRERAVDTQVFGAY